MLGLCASSMGLMPTQRLPVAGSHAVARSPGPCMAGAAALAKNERLIEEYRSSMEDAALMFCVRSEGIPVNEMSALRQSFPEDIKIKVCKNNLLQLASEKESVSERFGAIAGDEKEINRLSNMWFFVPEDQMRASVDAWEKHCKEFDNENRNSDIVGGVFGNEVMDAKGVKAVSKLPTKQELMAQTATDIKLVTTKLARVIKQAGAAERIAKGLKEAQGQKLSRAVNAMKDKLGD